jgi:PKD domain.
VNDIPTIENISTTQTQTDTDETTLTANISDEIGNSSVRWEFPDGTIKTGQIVTYPTQKTQYTVQLHVEDEYGADASAIETVVTPPEKTLIEQSTVPQQALIPGILSLIGIVGSVGGYRVVPWATILARIRRNPRIVELGTIFYDHEDRCLGVESIIVEDDHHPIIAIRLSIVNSDGDQLLTKEVTPTPTGTGTSEIGTYQYELTPAELYVPPTLSIDETEPYTIAVKTVNETEKTATEHTEEFHFDP